MTYTREDLANYTREELQALLQGELNQREWHSCPTPNNTAGRKRARQDALALVSVNSNITLIQSLLAP